MRFLSPVALAILTKLAYASIPPGGPLASSDSQEIIPAGFDDSLRQLSASTTFDCINAISLTQSVVDLPELNIVAYEPTTVNI